MGRVAVQRRGVDRAAGAFFANSFLSENPTDLLPVPLFYQVLSLSGNGFGDAVAAALGPALTDNDSLVALNLHNNALTDSGASALAAGLRFNRTLVSLSLGSNRLTDKGALALVDVLGPFALTHAETLRRRTLLASMASANLNGAGADDASAKTRGITPAKPSTGTKAKTDEKKPAPNAAAATAGVTAGNAPASASPKKGAGGKESSKKDLSMEGADDAPPPPPPPPPPPLSLDFGRNEKGDFVCPGNDTLRCINLTCTASPF